MIEASGHMPRTSLGLTRLPQPPETYRLVVQLNPLSFCQVHCLPTFYLDLQRRQHALTMALTNARLGEEERVGRTSGGFWAGDLISHL